MPRSRILVQDYQRLIAMKAFQTWRRLPKQTRAWLDVEDLIQEGVMFTRWHVIPRYNQDAAKFSTFLWKCLDRHFLNVLRHHRYPSWFEGRNLSLDHLNPAEEVNGNINFTSDEVLNMFSSYISLPVGNVPTDQYLTLIQTLSKIFMDASPKLRKSMRLWFFNNPESGKVQMNGRPFRKMRREFLDLAGKHGLDASGAATLLTSEHWKALL